MVSSQKYADLHFNYHSPSSLFNLKLVLFKQSKYFSVILSQSWMVGGGHRSPQINQFLNKTLLKFVEFTPKLLHFQKSAWSPKMFTPTFQYFYTDISAISVTYWIFVHISCHSLHHSNVYVLRGITAFSLLCFAHNPGKMAISLMPYLD